MAYTPTSWAAGDLITAQKLNKIEGGIEDANPLVVTFDAEYVADIDSDTILTALGNGVIVLAKVIDEEHENCFYSLINIWGGDNLFFTIVYMFSGELTVTQVMSSEPGTQWTPDSITLSDGK